MALKFGKTPAREGAVLLSFRKYANFSRLPTPPAEFGHDRLVKQPWGMLGNDQYGCCVWAGAAHETMLWNAERDVTIDFTTKGVLSDYSAVTGFSPNDPNTDNGTDMVEAAKYRQKAGIIGAGGHRHKIGAYLALTQGDIEEHLVAAFVFAAVGFGLTVPNTAEEQFQDGQPWAVTPGSTIVGSHYAPIFARRNGMFVASTWASEEPMTDAFFKANNDESLVYLSDEMLRGGKTPDGFDLDQLNADLKALAA